MIYPAEADIIPFVRSLVQSLQTYAQANHVSLRFRSSCKTLFVQYQPFSLGQLLMQLLCHIVNLVPHQSEVVVRLFHYPQKKELLLEIENTGINLLYVNGSILQSATGFTVIPLEKVTMCCLSYTTEQSGV